MNDDTEIFLLQDFSILSHNSNEILMLFDLVLLLVFSSIFTAYLLVNLVYFFNK